MSDLSSECAPRTEKSGVDNRLRCNYVKKIGRVKVTARSVVRVAFLRSYEFPRLCEETPARPFLSTGKVCLMQISKWIVAFVVVYGGLGGILFDAVIPGTARQHLWNPAWPPHAKFHNAQTMLMGLCNALVTLVLLFALRPLTLPVFLVAAALAAIYFACMLIAPVFPGTAWSDPEFEAVNPRPLGIPVQKLLSLVAMGLVGVAVVIVVATK